ncbi:MAG: guanylate kinase [Gammaproteobacteria bacterium]|nr:guanylate kinase [Gammaproteobacteria bacterium]MYK04844.1 guanylate kinase [Gammaproteobacteria bacterium]
MTSGALFIVTAPSGAGKTSLVRELVKDDDSLCISVSHTTRPRREGERDGVDYFFVDRDEFQRKLAEGAFLEHAKVYGHYYGTSHEWVRRQREQGLDVILEIDWQGAEQVRKLDPTACSIFILPPSVETLRRRLETRALDDEKTIDRRMRQAQREIAQGEKSDYRVVNDEFERALADIRAIIRSRRLRHVNADGD